MSISRLGIGWKFHTTFFQPMKSPHQGAAVRLYCMKIVCLSIDCCCMLACETETQDAQVRADHHDQKGNVLSIYLAILVVSRTFGEREAHVSAS